MNNYGVMDILGGIFGGFLIVFILIVIAIVIVSIVATWKLFEKAGKDGWKSIIPFYSSWVLIEIAGLNWWWFILLIVDVFVEFEIEGLSLAVSVCSFIASFNCYYNIARKFGKDKGISVLAGIFSFIFLLIFAFSKDEKYDNNIVVGKNGIFGGENNVNSDNLNKYNNVNNNVQSTDGVDMNVSSVNKKAFCGNCGNKLDDNAKFCGNCGKEI